MTIIVGPVTDLDVEVRLAIPAVATLIVDGVVTVGSSSSDLTSIGGVAVVADLPSIGFARTANDRSEDEGWTPVYASHPAHLPANTVCISVPDTLGVCVSCLLDVLAERRPIISELDTDHLLGLIVATSLASPAARVVEVNLTDLHRTVRAIRTS